jgi:hypothetical protein
LSVSRAIAALDKDWSLYSSHNHFGSAHPYMHRAFMEHCPVSERMLKAKLIGSAIREWRRRYHRDSMSYEDERSGLLGRLWTAGDRKRDYGTYFVLSARYGAYPMHLFASLQYPGKHYLKRAQKSARCIQRLWGRYWRRVSKYRFSNVTLIQTCWRRFICHKKYYPLVRLRLRMKDRLRSLGALHKWLDYLAMCSRMRGLVKDWLHFQRCELKVLISWRDAVRLIRNRRAEVLGSHLAMRRLDILRRYSKEWHALVYRRAHELCAKRNMSKYPHFYVWRARVKEMAANRKAIAAARCIQRYLRAKRTLIIVRRNKKVRQRLKQFLLIMVTTPLYTAYYRSLDQSYACAN